MILNHITHLEHLRGRYSYYEIIYYILSMRRRIFCSVFQLIAIDKNTKICYFLNVNPAWLQVLKLNDLPNWTRPLEDKMNISKTLDQASDSLEKVDWKQLTKEIVDLWVAFFKVIVTLAVLTYLIGKHLGHGIHRLNDWLAHHWVRVIVPQNSVETEQAPIIVEEVSTATPTITEVEPTLPLEESLSTLFNTPLMIAAVREPVALLAPELQEQQTPARRRRRQSAQPAVAVTEATPAPTQRPRGPRAHRDKQRARRAGQAA